MSHDNNKTLDICQSEIQNNMKDIKNEIDHIMTKHIGTDYLYKHEVVWKNNSVYIWCRDHRLHHRYSDTDADPHNSKRGFFFSHIGWLMCRKHPYVKALGKRIDMSDLESDWMVMFQKKKLQPVESWFVSFISLGEGWHNYHHTFPWDYNAAEMSMHFNISGSIIRLFEKLGLAYDLKSAASEMVVRHILKSGDGTHYRLGNDEAKKAVTAIGILHPLNPSYNVTYKSPNIVLGEKSNPLDHENDVIQINLLKRNYPTA
ncbi:unnamed protein product, partial [Brenthis ino]